MNFCYLKLFAFRSSHPEVFLREGVLEICSKFTREHPCRSVVSITLLCNLIEITLRHGCSPVNLLHIFRTPFPRNTSGWLLLRILHPLYHSKIIGHIFKNKQINKRVCIHESIRLIIIKMKIKMKNRSQRYDINTPRSRHII